MEFSCQTRWLNYELENAGGWENLLICKEVLSAMVYISTSATLLLAGECDRQMWRREQGALHVIKAEG